MRIQEINKDGALVSKIEFSEKIALYKKNKEYIDTLPQDQQARYDAALKKLRQETKEKVIRYAIDEIAGCLYINSKMLEHLMATVKENAKTIISLMTDMSALESFLAQKNQEMVDFYVNHSDYWGTV